MSQGKIVDHQITGKQKLAIGRDHDRSLDSLTATKDKRIQREIEKFVGQWPTIEESKNLHPSLQRTKKEKPVLTDDQKILKNLQERWIYLTRLMQRTMTI